MFTNDKIRVHVMRTGEVFIAPALAFGGNIIQASEMFTPKKDKKWFPASVYLIQHPEHSNILVDTGWDRSMSPKGKLNRKAWEEMMPFGIKTNKRSRSNRSNRYASRV